MKTIKLTQGKEALVDDEDYHFFSKFKWQASFDPRYDLWYATSSVGIMHRMITRASEDRHVDHIDKNGLNNQKHNLRICTISQNQMNRKTSSGTSRYKGVYWNNTIKQWQTEITHNHVRFRLGCTQSENEAARRYNDKAKQLFGEFALLNTLLELDRFYPDSYIPRTPTKTSQYKGVYFEKSKKKWAACIHSGGKKIKIGRFSSEEQAFHALLDYKNGLMLTPHPI